MNVTTVCYLYATVLCHLLCDENDWRSVIYSVIESKVVLADKFKKKKSLDYLIVSEQRSRSAFGFGKFNVIKSF